MVFACSAAAAPASRPRGLFASLVPGDYQWDYVPWNHKSTMGEHLACVIGAEEDVEEAKEASIASGQTPC